MRSLIPLLYLLAWSTCTWLTIHINERNWVRYAEVLLVYALAKTIFIMFIVITSHFLFWPIILIWALWKRMRQYLKDRENTLDITTESLDDDNCRIYQIPVSKVTRGDERWN